ncbi:UNVERIFIED_CONTAM: VPS10 domain-containing receptor SorCS1 [Gekko kuhli]
MHVISTDENQVFAAVQEWNQNDTYNLYISDTRGIYFTLALENVKSSQDLEGNVMIDLYEIERILADTKAGTKRSLQSDCSGWERAESHPAQVSQ